MKKILEIVFVCILCVVQPIHADNYIVMDPEDNSVYEGQNIHQQQSIASVSKIMTAMIAIEKGNIEDSWVVHEEITDSYGSMIYLEQGQQVNLIDLLYGLLLESGNDAADAIAFHVGGNNTEQFITWMNELAQKIGMKNTLYRNPSGLDEEDGGNLSTVYDQALLMGYALNNDIFCVITQTKYYTTKEKQHFVNHNKLLWNFNYTIAGKTGYTQRAMHTLASAARKDDITCIVVSFHMENEPAFHQSRYVKFFNQISSYTIVSPQVVTIDRRMVIIQKPFRVHVTKEDFEQGVTTVYFDDQKQHLVVKWESPSKTMIREYPYVK